MNLRNIIGSGLLGLALSSSAFAADQSIDISSGQASFKSLASVLDGGDDVLTFTGLTPGIYDYVFSISAQFITDLAGDVNGTPFAVAFLGPITAGALFDTGESPFTVTLTGLPSSERAIYSGELTVTAVPEPSGYLLMGAGLVAMLAFARRRRVS
jgi:PEP-CTERM motif